MRIYYLLFLLFFTACAEDAPLDFPKQTPTTSRDSADQRPEGIRLTETGHRKAEFQAKKTCAFDIKWNNRAGLAAHLVQRTDGSAIYIRYASGSQAWWDSKQVRFLPVPGDTLSKEQARFDLRAWHYWSCLPYKLDNPGTHWQSLPDRVLDAETCAVGRLSFDPGTGDTPDDWFAIFISRKKALVLGAAYVATFGHSSAEEAAKTPQMIRFEDFREVDGIPVAHRWLFTGWNTELLDKGTSQGEALLSNIKFGVPAEILNGN